MDLDNGGESPWGDEPSRSSSHVNLSKAGEVEESKSADLSLHTKPNQATSSASPTAARSPAGRSRINRKGGAHVVRLEAVDDSTGPLGPLGDNFSASQEPDEPPAPPQKEQLPIRTARPTTASSQGSLGKTGDSDDVEDDESILSGRARQPPPVDPPSGKAVTRQSQPSVSIEQAAKPTFSITVGDPHKVGDMTSSHTVYQVYTKTTSKAYRQAEFTVSRRYRDFLWLYNQLHNNNPGVVIPPPPEKQAVGRFDADFVESRRSALERMLNKTAAHPILQHDGDLKLFLESESFNMDIKNKERKDPGFGESKGMFSAIGINVGGGGGKFIEHDDWFHDRKIYLDALENQLKALDKAVETVVTQRKHLAEAAGDFSSSLHSLSAVELAPSLSGPLEGLSGLQVRIKELYERQAQQDVLTLGITVDEYLRLIGSVKTAFAQRQKAYHSWHAAESELQKRKANQEKILRQGKSQQDRLNQLNADVADAERRVHQARLLFEDMGRLMRTELERFEREKVEDFKSGVETFLESAVEAQKELIELWETFLMQLDAEDDEQTFFAPPSSGVPPVDNSASRPSTADSEGQTTAVVAATATAEQED